MILVYQEYAAVKDELDDAQQDGELIVQQIRECADAICAPRIWLTAMDVVQFAVCEAANFTLYFNLALG